MRVLNRAKTRQFILETFRAKRPGMGIERVSGDALDKIDARVRVWLIDEVMRHPTLGKTFKI